MNVDEIYCSVTDEKLEELREEAPVIDVQVQSIEVNT